MNLRILGRITSLLGCLAIALTAHGAASPLADAAEKADWARVQQLLKAKTPAQSAQSDGTTALHWAAYHNDPATVKLLLAAGADAKSTNYYGVAPLAPWAEVRQAVVDQEL